MPDHLQDPCAGCEKCRGYVNSEPICDAEFQECLEWRVYDARRDLLEKLKGEGKHLSIRDQPSRMREWAWQSEDLQKATTGPGYLVWIPEGE